jgi:glycosyltransferase involved in cell wall biosynthesis
VEDASTVRSCQSCNDFILIGSSREIPAVAKPDTNLTVVIPCHNYAPYIGELIQSLLDSTHPPRHIIVVDDRSSDGLPAALDPFPSVIYIRCEFGDVHKTRGLGLDQASTKYVAFIDADDKIPDTYIEEALGLFKTDRDLVCCYPVLQYFGAASGPAHGTERAPERLTADDLQQRNWISAGAIWRADCIRQSLAFKRHIDPSTNWSQDWHMAKATLGICSRWHAKRLQSPLLYRKHTTNMSDRPNTDYYFDAALYSEPFTIVIAFSGRWDCWPLIRKWLMQQDNKEHIRLLIMNGTHEPLTAKMLGLGDWYGSLQIERYDAGRPDLANQERRNRPSTGRQVEVAVAGIYLRATELIQTEYVLFVEDDCIPQQRNAIRSLMKQMGPWVAAISGAYRQRYQADKACAFSLPFTGNESFMPLEGTGVQRVDGTGFGLLLTRRSLLRRFPMASDGEVRFFDVEFCHQIKHCDNGWWQWLLSYEVTADHRTKGDLVAAEA